MPLPQRIARWIAADGQHVADARVGVLRDDMAKLGLRVGDDGEMAHRRQRRLTGDPLSDAHRRLPSRAAGAIGDGDERRLERLELADRLPEMPLALGGLGREELEGEGTLATREQIADRRRTRRRRAVGEALVRLERHAHRLETARSSAYPILDR